jgi:PPM family protein phosphatase
MGMGSTARHVQEPTEIAVAADRPWERDWVAFSVSAAGRTDCGQRRTENQDSVLCEVTPDGNMGLFAVADGMGGQNAGEVASALTVATLHEYLLPLLFDAPPDGQESPDEHGAASIRDLPLHEQVITAISGCNDRILLYGSLHSEAKGLGSTLNLVLMKGSLIVIGNVGDSRTYRVRGNAIERLTRDHSLVAHLVDLGHLNQDDVDTHPQRSYIYRALGADVEIQPDIFTDRVQSGDVLVLCSDGLWEMVRDDDIRRAISDEATADGAVARLVDMANANGGEDNISVIVVKVH